MRRNLKTPSYPAESKVIIHEDNWKWGPSERFSWREHDGRKEKELIMVGICCALRVQRGVRIHADRALTMGATPRQVLEAMEVAAIPGGTPGHWLGVETLKEILEQRGQVLE
jgi:hypothetical protein